MYKVKILPYSQTSDSAKLLKEALMCQMVDHSYGYTPKTGQVVINWGSGRAPNWLNMASAKNVPILNKFEAVNRAGNKLSTFEILSNAGVSIPKFTTNKARAQVWRDAGEIVVERALLRGNNSAGIRVVDGYSEKYLKDVPLYTNYIKKDAEYRVHIFRGQVIDMVERKRVRAEKRPDTYNKYVATVGNGYVFVRNGIIRPQIVINESIKAVNAIGLDFAAVDVVCSNGVAYVLELNTAPAIAETSLACYVRAIKDYVKGIETTTVTTRTPAVLETQAVRNTVTDDTVVLRLDRKLALKLRALLADI